MLFFHQENMQMSFIYGIDIISPLTQLFWTKTNLIMTISLQMSLECVVNAISLSLCQYVHFLFAILYSLIIIFDNPLIIDQHCFYVFLLMCLNSINFSHMKWREERVVMFGSRIFWNVRHLVECNINVIFCLAQMAEGFPKCDASFRTHMVVVHCLKHWVSEKIRQRVSKMWGFWLDTCGGGGDAHLMWRGVPLKCKTYHWGDSGFECDEIGETW